MEILPTKSRNVARKSTANRPLRPFNKKLTSNFVTEKLNTPINITTEPNELDVIISHKEVLTKCSDGTAKQWPNGLSNNLYKIDDDQSHSGEELQPSDNYNSVLEVGENVEGIFTLSDNMLRFYEESMMMLQTSSDSIDEIDLCRVLNYPHPKEDIQSNEPEQFYSFGSKINDSYNSVSNLHSLKRKLSDSFSVEVPNKYHKISESTCSEKSNKNKQVIDKKAIDVHEEFVFCENKVVNMVSHANDSSAVEKPNEICETITIDDEIDDSECMLKVEYALTLGDAEFDMMEESSFFEPCDLDEETRLVEPVEKEIPPNCRGKKLSLKSKKKRKRSKTELLKEETISNLENQVLVNNKLSEIENEIDKSKTDVLLIENGTESQNYGVSLVIETDVERREDECDPYPSDEASRNTQVENLAINDNSLGVTADIDLSVRVSSDSENCSVNDHCVTRDSEHPGSDCKLLQGSSNKKFGTNDKIYKSEINEGVLLHLEASKETDIMKDGKILKDKKELLKDIESKIEKNIPIEVKDFDIQQSLTEQILLEQALRLSHQRTSPRRRTISKSDEAKLLKYLENASRRCTRSSMNQKNKRSVDANQSTIDSNSLQLGLENEGVDNESDIQSPTNEKPQKLKVKKEKKYSTHDKGINLHDISQAFEDIVNDDGSEQSASEEKTNEISRVTPKNSKKKKKSRKNNRSKSKKSKLASTSMNGKITNTSKAISKTFSQTSKMPNGVEQTIPIILIRKCKLPFSNVESSTGLECNNGSSDDNMYISDTESLNKLVNSKSNIEVSDVNQNLNEREKGNDSETWTVKLPIDVSESIETNKNEDNSKCNQSSRSPSDESSIPIRQEEPDTGNPLEDRNAFECSLIIDEDDSNDVELVSPCSPELIDSTKNNISEEKTADIRIPFLDEPHSSFSPAINKPVSECLEAMLRNSGDSISTGVSYTNKPNNSSQELNGHLLDKNNSSSYRSQNSPNSEVGPSTSGSVGSSILQPDYYNPAHSPVQARPGSTSILQLSKPYFTSSASEPVYTPTYSVPDNDGTFTAHSTISGDAAFGEINSRLLPTHPCTSRNSDITSGSSNVQFKMNTEITQCSNTNSLIKSLATNRLCLTSDFIPLNISTAGMHQEENDESKEIQISPPSRTSSPLEQQKRVKDIPLSIVQRDPRLRNRKLRVLLISDDVKSTDLPEIKLNIDSLSEKIKDECYESPSDLKKDSDNNANINGSPKKKAKKKEIDEELLYRTPLSDLHDVPERSSYSRSIPKKLKSENKKDPLLHRVMEGDGVPVHSQEQRDPYTECNWNVNSEYSRNLSETGWQSSSYSELRSDNGLLQDNTGGNLYPQRYSMDHLQRQHLLEHQGILGIPNYINQDSYSGGYRGLPGDFSQNFESLHHQKDKGNSSFDTDYRRWDYAHQKLEGTFIAEDDRTQSDFVLENNWEDENKVRDFRPKQSNNLPYSRRRPWKAAQYRDDSNSRGGELFERRNSSWDSGPRRSSNDKSWEYYKDIVKGPVRRDSDERRYRNFRSGGRGRTTWSARRDYEMYGKKCPRSPR